MSDNYSIETLNTLDDNVLKQLDWKNLECLNGRLLELHAEGELGNDGFAKLPRKPILCIDQIERINEDVIEASFTFPASADDWSYETDEALEMLFQDQLDQLVGFWGSRKANGIGRALSSGACKLHQSLNFVEGKKVFFKLDRKKWVTNQATGTGTAIFNGRIVDENDTVLMETAKIIVGILPPADVDALRDQFGGRQGVGAAEPMSGLRVPLYDDDTQHIEKGETGLDSVTATQAIDPSLWPLRFHFKGDPVVPGNFGTHGMIALLKEIARTEFEMTDPVFTSLAVKKFSGMIFEDPKQIRFELLNVTKTEDGNVMAALANLYLEHANGERMIDTPIYTFKKLTVKERA